MNQTLENQIIEDLLVSQTTAHSLAERLRRRPDGISAHLLRMKDKGMVLSKTICDGRLTVWELSPEQKGAAV